MNKRPNWILYLYGFTLSRFVPPDPPPSPSEVAGFPAKAIGAKSLQSSGIDGASSPWAWAHGKVAAVVSWASQEDFCGAATSSNLQNLEWLGPRARRHQAVLQEVLQSAPVLPARFATLFCSIKSLSHFLEEHREKILCFLKKVTRQDEWAVKGFFDRMIAEEELCRRQRTQDESPRISSPGVAYLQAQGMRLKIQRELDDLMRARCDTFLEGMTSLASEACPRQVLSRETTGATQEMVLNWAFLVPRSAAADFQKRVKRINASRRLPGLTFFASGPWPPYSFCPALEAAPS